jgi:FkbM family methyltransferase
MIFWRDKNTVTTNAGQSKNKFLLMIDSLVYFAKQRLYAHPKLRQLLCLFRPPDRQLILDSYERLFEYIEGSVTVQTQDFGIVEIGCRSQVLRRILVERKYEPELVDALRKHVDPSKDALDIGANVGIFTIFLAGLLSEGRRVLAVEPTPGARGYLKRNIDAHNCADRVILFEGVATETNGDFTLNVVEGMEEFSSLLTLASPGIRNLEQKHIRVPGRTIDSLVEQHKLAPGIIKIDVEGAELQVLRGAKQTLLIHRPVICFEAWPEEMLRAAGGSRPGAAAEYLAACGYVIFDCGPNELVAMPKEGVN